MLRSLGSTSRCNHADSCADQRACFQQTLSPNSQSALPEEDLIPILALPFVTLSDLPSTQCFGLVVLAECTIDILINLFVLPLLGGARLKKARLRMRL